MGKAFTLIELLVVVVIIAILAAIAVPNFLDAGVRSKVSRAKADMRSLATALEAYAADHNKPMTTIVAGTANSLGGPSVFDPEVPESMSARLVRLTTPVAYITSIVRDPFEVSGWALPGAPPNVGGIDTYVYYCAFDYAPGGAFCDRPNFTGAGITCGAGWKLVSAGPDRFNGFGGGYVNQTDSEHASYGLDYDPSNGTVSRGDIVRVGGGPGPVSGPERLPAIDRIQNRYNQKF